MMATAPEGSTVRILNDVLGTVHEIHSPRTKGEIIHGTLLAMRRGRHVRSHDAVGACVHVTAERVTIHFYARASLEEAKKQLAEWLKGGAQ
jgi:hypothetical protein